MHYLRDPVTAYVAEIHNSVSALAFSAGFIILPNLHIHDYVARLQKGAHPMQLALLLLEARILPLIIRENGNAFLRIERQLHSYAATGTSADSVSDGVEIGFVGKCRTHRMIDAVRSRVFRRLLDCFTHYPQTLLPRYERSGIILNAVRFQIIGIGRLDDSLPANLRIVPVDGDRISARSVHRHRSQQGDNQASPQKTHCIFFHLPKPFVFQIRLLYHSLQIAALHLVSTHACVYPKIFPTGRGGVPTAHVSPPNTGGQRPRCPCLTAQHGRGNVLVAHVSPPNREGQRPRCPQAHYLNPIPKPQKIPKIKLFSHVFSQPHIPLLISHYSYLITYIPKYRNRISTLLAASPLFLH